MPRSGSKSPEQPGEPRAAKARENPGGRSSARYEPDAPVGAHSLHDIPTTPHEAQASRRQMRITALLVVIPVIGLVLVVLPLVRSYLAGRDAAAMSMRLLSRAHSREELEKAVGDMGVVLSLRDGQWIAVRYDESEETPEFSNAVARCSDGSWFESTSRHSGRFQIYRKYVKEIELATAAGERGYAASRRAELESNASFAELILIERSPDIGSAERALADLAFGPVRGPH